MRQKIEQQQQKGNPVGVVGRGSFCASQLKHFVNVLTFEDAKMRKRILTKYNIKRGPSLFRGEEKKGNQKLVCLLSYLAGPNFGSSFI